jgi:nitrogen fixation/metabolism regulation signal transduction histidine kinase
MNPFAPLRSGRDRLHARVTGVGHDIRILILALAAGLPGSAITLWLIWRGDYTPKVQWTVTVFLLAIWLGCAFALRQRVVFPLQTLSNLLSALREGDYSIRARVGRRDDPLGEVMIEVNTLSETLHQQRLSAIEAAALLDRVIKEIDIAVFAFTGDDLLILVNRAGERLLGQPTGELLGRSAEDLGLQHCLEGRRRLLELQFPGGSGRWEVQHSAFRQEGFSHKLLVLTDLSRALREEERKAWQRLIRVIGHELNNSLAPIKSIAASLESLLARRPLPPDWDEDMKRGLAIIESRSESLSRFMEGYARLAQLPPPQLRPVEVGSWIRRVAGLETRLGVELQPGPDLVIEADGDQLEQLLINLVRNAADAALQTGGGVAIRWGRNATHLEVAVEDEGPGLPDTANLFVPFFTTKRHGSGIGLVLCRQIAEAHGGAVVLENRKDRQGCRARLRLPV